MACAHGCATAPHALLITESDPANRPAQTASYVGYQNEALSPAVSSADLPRLPSIDEGPVIRASDDTIDQCVYRASHDLEDQAVRLASVFQHEQSATQAWPEPLSGDQFTPMAQLTWPLPAEDDHITLASLFAAQWAGIRSDHGYYYSVESLSWLTMGLGVGAVMANTGFDEHAVRSEYAESVVFAPSDELYEALHEPKFLGDGNYTIPVYVVAALAAPLIEDLPLGQPAAHWGQRSLRTVLVGAPPMLALQLLTGGSRPGETAAGSHWKPLRDSNGVSGHSFMGAVPFMSAAKMTDSIWLKSGLYAASTLPALSRVNDDDHYFSQSFLGWWLAYVAASAVDCSHHPDANHHLFFYPQADGLGVALEFSH